MALDKKIIKNYVTKKIYPENYSDNEKRTLRRKCEGLIVHNENLYKEKNSSLYRFFFPETDSKEIEEFLSIYHCTNHSKEGKLFAKIKDVSVGITRQMVRDFIKKCKNCQISETLQTYQTITPIKTISKFERFQMDLISFINYQNENDDYKYVLNVIDCFSKYLWSFPLKDKKSMTVVICLQKIFFEFLPPKILHSDNGREFKSKYLSDLCKKYEIIQVFGRARNPKSQGQIERLNQTIKNYITRKLALKEEKRWINLLPSITSEYNLEIHSSNKRSPKQIMFGVSKNYFVGNLISKKNILKDFDSNSEPCTDFAASNSSFDTDQLISINDTSFFNDNDLNINRTNSSSLSTIQFVEKDISSSIDENISLVREKYLDRMVKNSKKHSKGFKFFLGCHVLIKKDFDKNIKTKNKGLDTNHFPDIYVIIFIKGNLLKIENKKGEIIEINTHQVDPFFK